MYLHRRCRYWLIALLRNEDPRTWKLPRKRLPAVDVVDPVLAAVPAARRLLYREFEVAVCRTIWEDCDHIADGRRRTDKEACGAIGGACELVLLLRTDKDRPDGVCVVHACMQHIVGRGYILIDIAPPFFPYRRNIRSIGIELEYQLRIGVAGHPGYLPPEIRFIFIRSFVDRYCPADLDIGRGIGLACI